MERGRRGKVSRKDGLIPWQPRRAAELRPCRRCRDIWVTPTDDGRCPGCGGRVQPRSEISQPEVVGWFGVMLEALR